MVNEFSLNGELYRRYDNKYFVTNDGVVAIIEFDENNNLKRYIIECPSRKQNLDI